jgi:RNA-directed DNA polymerase
MQRVCEILKCGRGRNIRRMLEERVPALGGWASYFSLVDVKSTVEALDGWVRPPQRSALYQGRLKDRSGRESS